MKNAIKYYYNIDVENIKQSKDEYKFYKNEMAYSLILTDRTEEEINQLYELVGNLHKLGIPCHQIIYNKSRNLLTNINNKNYVLMRKYITINDPITINDIISFNSKTTFDWNYPILNRTNWKELWMKKLDYFEYQLSQIGRKYPKLTSTFSYYEGITENAIQLINIYNIKKDSLICVSHKRISFDTTLTDFYNPLNFIIDYKVRDIAEYLKQKNNIVEVDIDIIRYLLDTYILNDDDKILFIIRIFFPSFYFDVYENILLSINDEKHSLASWSSSYEKLIKKIYVLVNTYIKLPNVEWFI